MSNIIFRRIAGRIVPIAQKASGAIDRGAGSLHRAIMSKTGLTKSIRSTHHRKTIQTFGEGGKFEAVIRRRYGDVIKKNAAYFDARPRDGFSAIQWTDIYRRNAPGQAWAEVMKSPVKSPADIGKIGAGVQVKDAVTATHELGHVEQFRTASKLTKLRFARAGKFGGKTLEVLHEADAYRRGIKMTKSRMAKKVFAKAATGRIISAYGPDLIKIGGSAAAAGGIAGVAIAAKRSKTKRTR